MKDLKHIVLSKATTELLSDESIFHYAASGLELFEVLMSKCIDFMPKESTNNGIFLDEEPFYKAAIIFKGASSQVAVLNHDNCKHLSVDEIKQQHPNKSVMIGISFSEIISDETWKRACEVQADFEKNTIEMVQNTIIRNAEFLMATIYEDLLKYMFKDSDNILYENRVGAFKDAFDSNKKLIEAAMFKTFVSMSKSTESAKEETGFNDFVKSMNN